MGGTAGQVTFRWSCLRLKYTDQVIGADAENRLLSKRNRYEGGRGYFNHYSYLYSSGKAAPLPKLFLTSSIIAGPSWLFKRRDHGKHDLRGPLRKPAGIALNQL